MVFPVCIEKVVKEFDEMYPSSAECRDLVRAVFTIANEAYEQGRCDESNHKEIRR